MFVVSLIVGSCGGDPNPSPSVAGSAATCLELVPAVLPPDFEPRDRIVSPGPAPAGLTVVFGDGPAPDGRELTVRSGVGGELPGVATGEILEIRGTSGTITHDPDGEILAVSWTEARADTRCGTYAVVSWKVSREEFLRAATSLAEVATP